MRTRLLILLSLLATTLVALPIGGRLPDAYGKAPAWRLAEPTGTGIIEGTVSTTETGLAEGMCALIWHESTLSGPGPEPVFVETDADGAYSAVVPAGNYFIHLWDCDTGRYEWEFFDDKDNVLAADLVSVTDGGTSYVTTELRVGGGIKGTVTADAAGAPVADIEVRVRDDVGYWTHWYAMTDADGTYWITGLRPGAVHHVEFWDPSETYRWEYFDDRPRFALADSVTVVSDTWTADIDAALGPWYAGEFSDDDTSVFAEDIEWLAAEGITKGCNPPENTKFCPADYVTRGQMAAFLVRALGYTDDGGGDLFTDDNGSIFELDIDKLGTAGVTMGCNPPENDRFCPQDYVTRGQMAAFLHRALASDAALSSIDPAGPPWSDWRVASAMAAQASSR